MSDIPRESGSRPNSAGLVLRSDSDGSEGSALFSEGVDGENEESFSPSGSDVEGEGLRESSGIGEMSSELSGLSSCVMVFAGGIADSC